MADLLQAPPDCRSEAGGRGGRERGRGGGGGGWEGGGDAPHLPYSIPHTYSTLSFFVNGVPVARPCPWGGECVQEEGIGGGDGEGGRGELHSQQGRRLRAALEAASKEVRGCFAVRFRREGDSVDIKVPPPPPHAPPHSISVSLLNVISDDRSRSSNSLPPSLPHSLTHSLARSLALPAAELLLAHAPDIHASPAAFRRPRHVRQRGWRYITD